jgi:uncharacterized membrane protein HdeD (DUF308 family)
MLMTDSIASLNTVVEQRTHAVWFLVTGVSLMVLGVLALCATGVVTSAGLLLFGVLLFAAGASQVLSAVLARGWRGFVFYLACGVMYLAAGLLVLQDPTLGTALFTVLLGSSFLVAGFARLILALISHYLGGWEYGLCGGAFTVAIGVALIPGGLDQLWLIGLAFGIDILELGAGWLLIGVGLRRLQPTSQDGDSATYFLG